MHISIGLSPSRQQLYYYPRFKKLVWTNVLAYCRTGMYRLVLYMVQNLILNPSGSYWSDERLIPDQPCIGGRGSGEVSAGRGSFELAREETLFEASAAAGSLKAAETKLPLPPKA